MKQISFTNIGRFLFLMLAACCLLGLQSAFAQDGLDGVEDIRLDGDNASCEYDIENDQWDCCDLRPIFDDKGNIVGYRDAVCDPDIIEVDCGDDQEVRFEYTDDGGRYWNYNETEGGEDIPPRFWTFCPDDALNILKIEFTMWDVGNGTVVLPQDPEDPFNTFGLDQFIIFDANTADRDKDGRLSAGDIDLDGNGSIDDEIYFPYGETGVPDAPGGGIVTAGCDNETGCLTVYFNPTAHDVDGEVGAGWVFKVVCEPRPIEIVCPADESIPSVHLFGGLGACLYQGIYTMKDAVEIKCAPAGVTKEDDVYVVLLPQPVLQGLVDIIQGPGSIEEFIDEIGLALLTGNALQQRYQPGKQVIFTPNLDGAPLGNGGCFGYSAIYIVDGNDNGIILDEILFTLLNETEGLLCEQELWLCPPALVCNDEINVALNNDCTAYITPDHVLEDPCLLDLLHYDLALFGEDGRLIPNRTITSAQIGTMVKAVVSDRHGNVVNSCWTKVNVEDNISPTARYTGGEAYIYCGMEGANGPGAIDINKDDIPGIKAFEYYDNCGATTDLGDWTFMPLDCKTVSKTVAVNTPDCRVIRRNFRVVGKYTRTFTVRASFSGSHNSKTATATQTVHVLQPRVEAPKNALVECADGKEDLSPAALAKIDQRFVPYYWFSGRNDDGVCVTMDMAIPTDHGTCGYSITYSDSDRIPTDCGYKVFRTYQYFNWCTGTMMTEAGDYTQVIVVEDRKDPMFTDCKGPNDRGGLNNPHIIGTNRGPFECAANVAIPTPTATDNCELAGVQLIGVYRIVGAADGTVNTPDPSDQLVSRSLTNIPLNGCEEKFYAEYRAVDACGNTTGRDDALVGRADEKSNCRYYFNLIDDDAPVCVADEYTVVPLDATTGTVTICADNLDSGTYDNCDKEVEILIAKKEAGPYSRCLELSCEDLLSDELDNAHDLECPGTVNIFFKATDNCDNSSVCMVEVELQDKIKPVIVGGPDKTRQCDFKDPYSLFNEPVATDNCSTPTVKMIRETGKFDECGRGSVTRTWEATDACGNKATTSQTISLYTISDYVVTFPADIDEECVGNDYEFDPSDLKIENDDCENILIRHSDKLYTGVEGACYKIFRTIEVINWCVYDAAGEAPATQDNTTLGTRKFKDGGDGYIKYVQIIKVKDRTAPVITPQDDIVVEDRTAGCEGPITLSVDAIDECTGKDNLSISFRIDAFVGTADEIAGLIERKGSTITETFPYGKHRITFWVKDGCGNTSELSYHFTIKDAKKPGIVCVSFLSADLMPIDTDGDGHIDDGMAEVWAREFVKSYGDNCPSDCDPSDPASDCFLIDDITAVASYNASTPPSSAKTGLQFDCDDLGSRRIAVWARDKAGNWDYCTAFLELQNNMGACGDTKGSIAGTIETETKLTVENVKVEVTGMDMLPSFTGHAGAFSFLAPLGGNYTIVPEKDINPLNGVSTLDIVLISQHILGTKELDSPYKLIAADVNNSGSISALDLVQMRQLILNVTAEFPSNTSWRFVDKGFEFATPNNPWSTPFPEVVTINGLNETQAANFVGIKVGDVNNNAIGAEVRNAVGAMTFKAADATIAAGEEYTVEFTSADMSNVLGYQFTMNFDQSALELVDVKAGALAELTEANFGLTKLDEGVITTSWNAANAVASTDEVLFSMTFKANADVTLSEAISISSRYTAAEAYDANLNLLDVAIEFGNTVVAEGFELYQNTPNPFQSQTVIGFNLPQAGAATLTVMDISGRVLKVVEGDYAKGYNTVTLNRSELSGAGVLYYQLNTDNDSATKKMILVE